MPKMDGLVAIPLRRLISDHQAERARDTSRFAHCDMYKPLNLPPGYSLIPDIAANS